MKKLRLSLILILFLNFHGVSFAETVPLGDVNTSGEYYINGIITLNGVVSSTVNLEMIAQEKIQFLPGFKILQGGTLTAEVSPDTDGDLVLDLVEERSGCSNKLLADTDGDGLSDSAEDANRNGRQDAGETLACNADTDGDQIDDKWELDNLLNPLDAADASLDTDGDTLTNYYEYYFKSDPNSSSSLPKKGSYYEYDELGRIKKIIRIK